MTSIHFKKSPSEKAQLKKIKKEHIKNLKAINPELNVKKAFYGFKTNQMSHINVILDLAQKAQAALSN